MRTEQDVRRILALREELVPDPDAVLAGVQRVGARRRRRRVTGAVLGAAAAVVLVATLPVALSGLGSSRHAELRVIAPAASTSGPASRPPAPSGFRPPFAFTIAPGHIAGFDLEPQTVNPDVQSAAIRPPGAAQQRGTLFVYRPGSNVRVGGDASGWDVQTEGKPTPVSVNGAPGFYTANSRESALRWEYAKNGWAVISNNYQQAPLALDTLQQLAEGVRFVAPYQARVPYRLDYLPADLVPFHVLQETSTPGAFRSVVQLESRNAARQYAIDITIVEELSWPSSWKTRRTTIAGHSARCTDLIDGRRCALTLGGFTVDLGCGGLNSTELSRLVAGFHPATWTDPTTWSEVSAVFPGTS